jgi:zeaxanthin glucosyltransferase
MLDLMPRLDAVVCQAGQSTVNEALVHGVPLVAAPIRLHERTVAEQVTRAGAGVTVSFAAATPAQLAAALTAVLDEPGYRASARRVSQEFAAAGGTGAAAAHLAALAGSGTGGASAVAGALAAARPAGRPGLASDHPARAQPEGADER